MHKRSNKIKVQSVDNSFSLLKFLQNNKETKQVWHLLHICFYVSYTNLMFLKRDGVGDLTPGVPSVQHFFSGVVVHHGVVAVLVCELYVGVPLFSCLGVVSKVDGSGLAVIGVDTVDYSTGNKSITHRTHLFCP